MIDTHIKRLSYMVVDPRLVHVSAETMGRPFVSCDYDEKIADLAVSLSLEGQLSPVGVRTVNGEYVVVYGNRRTQAAQALVTGFEHHGTTYHDPDFRLKVMPVSGNEKESFLRNVAENAMREATTPIDDAINQRRLREDYGMTNTEIAQRFGYSVQTVATLEKLLALEDSERRLVADGALSVSAALDLLKLPVADRTATITGATKVSKTGATKVDSAKLRDSVREAAIEAGVKLNSADMHGKSQATKRVTEKVAALRIARPWKDVKDVIRQQNPTSPAARNLMSALLGYADGTIDITAFAKAVTALDLALSTTKESK